MKLFIGLSGLVALAVAGTPVWSASTQYNQCVAAIVVSPEQALSQAENLKARGGGAAADHCAALALIALKRPAEAAARLEMLAALPVAPAQRAAFLAQAGNAWLMAGQSSNADSALSSALALAPNDVEVLIDRAGARAMRKDWAGAEADLTHANALNKTNPAILVLRASARAAQGHRVEARADIDAALALNPVFGDALVERGAMKFAAGDKNGARADWQQATTAAPGSAAAATAKKYLQSMDSSP
jgi:tetratricopeptide (TPR) repeat protein